VKLKAPFPAFGGKGRVASAVIARIDGVEGDEGRGVWDPVDNWIEPFAFSAIVTLRRKPGRIETINDRNAFVSNFWRAVQADPERVAHYADWPVNETDLHARHRWLVGSDQANRQLARVGQDPEFFDAKIAGWWCWGACCWIGSGWCDEGVLWQTRPNLAGDGGGNGVHRCEKTWDGDAKRLNYNADGLGNGIARLAPSPQLPHLDAAGRGVQGTPSKLPHLDAAISGQLPRLTGANGVVSSDHLKRCRLASFDRPGTGVCGEGVVGADDRRRWIMGWMRALADRLRAVRVCCGHWSRVCDSPSTMTRLGTTGVFLDPPYRVSLADGSANRTRHIYANDRHQDVNALCDEVQAWCLKWCDDPAVRIALCGLEGEYPEIERTIGKAGGWSVLAWTGNGGYGNRKGGAENVNRHRERVWFSPHCLRLEREADLFSIAGEGGAA
jgi:hypothetical protein